MESEHDNDERPEKQEKNEHKNEERTKKQEKNEKENTEQSKKKEKIPNPYLKAFWFSKLTFFWMNTFVFRNRNKEFNQEDHFELEDRYNVKNTHEKSQEILDNSKNLWIFFLRAFPKKLLLICVTFFYAFNDLFQVYIMYTLTTYLNDIEVNKNKIDKWYMAQIFGLILLSQLLANMISLITFYLVFNELVMVKNNFMIHIFNKTLKIKSKSSSDNFEGNIINLIQVDCQKFESQGAFFFYIFYSFISIISTFSLAFYMMGVAFLSYLGISVFVSICSGFLFKLNIRYEKQLLALRDQRITLQNNLFKNIRFIKFNVYENFFVKYLYDFKKKELFFLKRKYFMIACIILIFWINPAISLAGMFLTYFSIHKFMSLGFFMGFEKLVGTIEGLFRLVPWVLNTVAQLYITFQRLSKFLGIKETDLSFITHTKEKKTEDKEIKNDEDDNIAIEFTNGNFKYDYGSMNDWVAYMKKSTKTKKQTKEEIEEEKKKEEEKEKNLFKLSNLNFQIKKGELIFIIGKIGCGKSSLLGSMIGQLKYEDDTKVKINGNYVYCPQTSYLMTKSIKDNITFYKKFDKERFDKSIKMADMGEDIKSFDDGVEKVITEGGMNLSGGQRLRINLARTFYQEKDIYLFDDPFSSLDIHVSCRIIENAIIKDLKGKTRIVVSHSIQYLKYADRIMYMDNGKIEFFDCFDKFKETDYFGVLQNTINKKEEKEVEKIEELELLEIEKQVSEKLVLEKNIKSMKSIEKKKSVFDEEKDKYIKKYFMEEEKYVGRKLGLMIKLLIKYYGGVLALIFILAMAALPNYFYYYSTLYLYDTIKNMKDDPDSKWKRLVNYTLLIILPNIASFFRFGIILLFQTKMVKRLHHKMMIHATHGDLLGFYDKIPIGRLTNKFSNDLTSIEDNFIYNYNGTLLFFVMLVIDLFIICVSISPIVVVFMIFYIILVFYFQNIYIKINKDIFRLENMTKTPIVHLTTEIIKGRNIIQIAEIEDKIIDEVTGKINANNKNVIAQKALGSWFTSNLVLFNIFFVQLASFSIFLYMVGTEVDTKSLVICINYMFCIIGDLNAFINSLSGLETQVVYLERCEAMADIPAEKNYKNLEKNYKFLENKIENELEEFLPIKNTEKAFRRFDYEEINDYNFKQAFFEKGKIEFKNVFAKYPINDNYVLKDINFVVNPGEKLGICGQTGSGKSTIIKLINQYLNVAKGKVLIDDYDVTKIDLKKLRSEFLIISQEIALFNGTIKENLNPKYLIKKNQKKKKVEQDVTRSNLEEPLIVEEDEDEDNINDKEIIDCLINFGFSKEKLKEKGLNFVIENGGKNLSEGEQQLITIFRALFTEKKIIILDEATSSIDYETEKKIIDFFYKKIKDKTVISIAHRINTVLGCDKIIILKDGEIVEVGAIEELLAKKDSLFKEMYDKVNQHLE